MKVRLTEFLRQSLIEMGEAPDAFIEEFASWKRMGAAGANNHRYYGKDGEYEAPLFEGSRVLRHVHLEPADDSPYFRPWDRAWWRRGHGKRVSDTALVYAFDSTHGYLLITILWEPNAHEIARMQSEHDRDLMHDLAAVAGQFIFDGTCEV